MNFRTKFLERMLTPLVDQIEGAMRRSALLSLPTRRDLGDRFVHSMNDMPTVGIFMSTRTHDRYNWDKLISEIKKSGVYTTVTTMINPWDAGASCDYNNYKIVICVPDEKDILLRNGWAIGNIIVSVPNMDKAAALKGLVRAWIATWIK